MTIRACAAATILLALAVTVRATGALTSPALSATPRQAGQTNGAVPQLPKSGYAGTDTCVTCHEAEGKSLKGTRHAQAADPRTPMANHGCESCHGPGQAHVDDDAKGHMKKLAQMTPAAINETCLACHNRGEHAGWEGSAHERRNLSCTTCHSVHNPKSPERQLVQPTQTQVCATCHRLQVSKTERAVAHMPVREGKMSCSSCHNPHGSISNVKNLKTGSSVAELCTSCHTEMRGPVLWEHAPVRENCMNCHQAHGSNHDALLIAARPYLCQQCHTSPALHAGQFFRGDQTARGAAAGATQSPRIVGRACQNCHSQVHGSNHPSGARFQR